MDARALQRLSVLNHVLAGTLTREEASRVLGISIRSVRRMLAWYRGPAGVAGLVHGNVGRTPANRTDPAIRHAPGRARAHDIMCGGEPGPPRRAARRARGDRRRGADAAGPRRGGLPAARTRRPRGPRSRFERMSAAGMLVQVDGSRHDWLEDRGPLAHPCRRDRRRDRDRDRWGLPRGRGHRGIPSRARQDRRRVRDPGRPVLRSPRHLLARTRDRPLARRAAGRRPTTQVGCAQLFPSDGASA